MKEAEELYIDVPEGEELPTSLPGDLLTMFKDGAAVKVRVIRIEDRTIIFTNVEVH